MPKVSVITINFNNAAGLEKTIISVLEQSFTDLEYIVIDGGSTDGSAEIIKKYADRITFWISERDKGIYNAQNKGIKKATGEYCLFLNSGDYLADSSVIGKVFAAGYTDDIIYGDMFIDNGSGKPVLGTQPDTLTFEYLIHTTLWHPVSFIKRSLFDKFGLYNEELKIISDYEFFLKVIICENCTTRHVPVAVSVFNTMGIGSSKEHEVLHKNERRLVQEKYFDKQTIATAERYNSLQRSKAVELSSWLDKRPVIKGIVNGCFSLINGLRKITRS
jgi:glycosyltransferase involved in cell wall biosynthesis